MPTPPAETQITRHVPCSACGCVCDDLEVTVAGNRIVHLENSCPIADEWFAAQSVQTRPVAEIEGREVSLDEALTRAAQILDRADAPLIYGLSRSNTAGQKAAVHLAAELGACIDTTASQCHGPSIMAIQEMGESTCTLGEVRNRADLVIYWGCNPAETHPRHAERYAVFPRGRHIPRGRADRTVVLVGTAGQVEQWRLDRQGSLPDLVIPIEPRRDFEALTALLALVRGWPKRPTPGGSGSPDSPDRHRTDPDLSRLHDVQREFALIPILQDLAERMKSCRCGIVFFGLGITGMVEDRESDNPMPGQHNVHLLLKLVAELNAHTRFFARRMRIYGDVTGADNVLCWQTGYPFGVSLARGTPRYNPGEFTADDLLARHEVDACLLVGTETYPLLRPESRQRLEELPTIVLDNPGTEPAFTPTVRFTTAACGLSTGGTIYRMDGVPLEMRGVLTSRYPTDDEVLHQLRQRLVRGD